MKKTVLILLVSFISTPALACKNVAISDGWIRLAPPGASVMAAYVQIKNNGNTPRTITTISSKRFGAIEAHQTVIESGTSQMRSLDSLTIPAHGELRLEPGGKHLMLFRPTKSPLQLGDKAVLNFRCAKSKPMKAEFVVKAAP